MVKGGSVTHPTWFELWTLRKSEFGQSIVVTSFSTEPLSVMENVESLGVNITDRECVVRVKRRAREAADNTVEEGGAKWSAVTCE